MQKCLLFPLSFIVAYYSIFGDATASTIAIAAVFIEQKKKTTTLVLVNKVSCKEEACTKTFYTKKKKNKTLIIINVQDASFAF